MDELLLSFLLKNNYSGFSRQDIILQLHTHPNYPSFASITDTLDYFGVDNIAANVPEDALSILPKYFLTMINNENGVELVLATNLGNKFILKNRKGKKVRLNKIEFLKVWSKTIIAIEKTKESKKSLFKLFGYYTIFISIVLVLLSKMETNINHFISFLLLSIGLYLSFLLVREKIGYHSIAVSNVCKAFKKNSCNLVINSQGGNIYKNFSLADASFLFFIIMLISNFLYANNVLFNILILSTIPVVIYSIYYQAFVIKKWCVLCLAISMVLLILSGFTFYFGNYGAFLLSHFIELATIFIVLGSLFFVIKELIVKNKKYIESLTKANRFKRDPVILNALLKDAETSSHLYEIDNEIKIGNQNGDFQIIALTNPLCGFCKIAFESYLKLIRNNDSLTIVIRFISRPKDLKDRSTLISARLIELYKINGPEYFSKAYTDWLDNKDINSWIDKYKSPKYELETIKTLNEQYAWSNESGITYTPATIIGNQIFSQKFDYDDLPTLIDYIIDFQVNK
jgi:uncharacterized membrane protein